MDDDELRHWQEVEHHLNELTKHPGWGALTEYAHLELMKGVKNRLLNASHKNYDWETNIDDRAFCRGVHALLDTPKFVRDRVSNAIDQRRAQMRPVDDAA